MIILLLAFLIGNNLSYGINIPSPQCQQLLGKGLVEEIINYHTVAYTILKYVVYGDYKNKTYDELAKFVTKFGPRPSGSNVLEQSIDYMISLAQQNGIYDIKTDELVVPHWTRGDESLVMIKPRNRTMALLGLGHSVSTPPNGITAQAIVVQSFKEFMDIPRTKVAGKIVVFNPTFINYYETVNYRYQGATKAAEKGAVASLVRSITPFSIYSPHTGIQTYGHNVAKIPTAAITIEDANYLERLYKNGETIVLHLLMFSQLQYSISRNTMVDFKGTENPEKLVIVSAHIDSWDIAEGAIDNAGGLFLSWAVPVILKKLNLRPKRTIRSIFWTAEEPGAIGAYNYAHKHKNESHNINFIMESDEGTYKPEGLRVAGSPKALCILVEILKLFEPMNASTVIADSSPGSDISLMIQKYGVPGATIYNRNRKYWWFQHSKGDTLDIINTHDVDLNAGFWASVAYILADLSIDIPR